MKSEITSDLNLSPQQESLLDMHSFLNVMNVLNAWLNLLRSEIDKKEILKPSIEHITNISETLVDKNKALASARSINKTKKIVYDNLAELEISQPNINESTHFKEIRENFDSIFNILNTWSREILARYNQDEPWVKFKVENLVSNIIDILKLVEMNSHGKFRIVYNPAAKTDNDYLINMRINSVDGDFIRIPAIFQDVMRDLILNARKYSAVGSIITFELKDDGKKVHFRVSDNGLGIPEDQIEQVVNYGQRARNVLDKRAMGGGFGLTKAYYVTRQFKGRFWIDSNLGQGTEITIEFPRFDLQ